MNAIFEATVRVLPKIGNKALTTKKIAEIAGVSIGSLYQYFPNKDAVLMAVMDRSIQETAAKIDEKIDAFQGTSMNEGIDYIIDFGLDIFLNDKETIREVYRRAPEFDRVPTLLKLRQHVVKRLADQMQQFNPVLKNEDYLRISFIAVNSVLGVIQTMIYDENQIYSKQELSFELKSMVRAYLKMRCEVTK